MKRLKQGDRKEIEKQIKAYRKAQEHQLKYGGPGPVASEEIMDIVNCHKCEFHIEGEPEPKKPRKPRKPRKKKEPTE